MKYYECLDGFENQISVQGGKMADISIIIPTCNERNNVEILLERIHQCVKRFDYEVVIVDDDSPDGTGYRVKELSEKYPAKTVVRRNEKGLAMAVVEGFKHATGDILIVMDADLQHPPEKLVALIEEIYNGADIVIGSRYAEKNGFGEFSFSRKMTSKCANVLAKILFQKLSKINDIQSGFFALKTDVVNGVNLTPAGYKILLEILIVGNYKNVKEVPYIFSKRKKGKSKFSAKISLDYIFHLLNLLWRREKWLV
jgi:dolichol-phosphate mannosyltransferase